MMRILVPALSVVLLICAPAAAVNVHDVVEEIAANMVEIPGGTYEMWVTPGLQDRPGHWVKVEPFLMGRYEVTQGEYRTIMNLNPSHFQGDPNQPVEQVSWEDAKDFVRKLNAMEGGQVYRLPTDAEWEYACLAGATNPYGFCRAYHRLGQYAWYAENSGGKTHPVGQLRPSPWGLYDIHGNVWEWCEDWHGEHLPGEVTEPKGLMTPFKVVRGGGYDSPEGDCRSHARRNYSPVRAHRKNVGFRLAATGPIRVSFARASRQRPQLTEFMTEKAFDRLTIAEQHELIGMIDKHSWLLSLAERYNKDYPEISQTYTQRAESLKEQIEARFGHVRKK
jgi:formylglycine-generating enzyme required for sulfatase activity